MATNKQAEATATAGNGVADAVTVLLAEYTSLKDEQRSRIDRRDHLAYANLAATAAAVAVAVQGHAPALLLAVPPIGFLLGWTYLANDRLVTAIGGYLRDRLAPRLAQLAGEPVVFGWEHHHASDAGRVRRKRIQLGADLATFCLPGILALAVLTVAGPVHPWTAVAAGLDTAGVVVLGWQLIAHAGAGLARRTGGCPPAGGGR